MQSSKFLYDFNSSPTVIYNSIKARYFSDYRDFDNWMGSELKQFIHDFQNESYRLNFKCKKNVNKILLRYYNPKEFPYNLKQVRKQIDVVFKTTLILLLEQDKDYISDNNICFFSTCEELKKYFQKHLKEIMYSLKNDRSLTELKRGQELEFLRNFFNYHRLALPLIPVRSNKHLLLSMLGRLEGSNTQYVTGSGKKPCVIRRYTYIIEKQKGGEPVSRNRIKRQNYNKYESPEGKREKITK